MWGQRLWLVAGRLTRTPTGRRLAHTCTHRKSSRTGVQVRRLHRHLMIPTPSSTTLLRRRLPSSPRPSSAVQRSPSDDGGAAFTANGIHWDPTRCNWGCDEVITTSVGSLARVSAFRRTHASGIWRRGLRRFAQGSVATVQRLRDSIASYASFRRFSERAAAAAHVRRPCQQE